MNLVPASPGRVLIWRKEENPLTLALSPQDRSEGTDPNVQSHSALGRYTPGPSANFDVFAVFPENRHKMLLENRQERCDASLMRQF